MTITVKAVVGRVDMRELNNLASIQFVHSLHHLQISARNEIISPPVDRIGQDLRPARLHIKKDDLPSRESELVSYTSSAKNQRLSAKPAKLRRHRSGLIPAFHISIRWRSGWEHVKRRLKGKE